MNAPMSTITTTWLTAHNAYPKGMTWFTAQRATDSVGVLHALLVDQKLDWANWLIVRVMTRPQYLAYAIFSAEQVIDFYEKQYPTDDSPQARSTAGSATLCAGCEQPCPVAELTYCGGQMWLCATCEAHAEAVLCGAYDDEDGNV